MNTTDCLSSKGAVVSAGTEGCARRAFAPSGAQRVQAVGTSSKRRQHPSQARTQRGLAPLGGPFGCGCMATALQRELTFGAASPTTGLVRLADTAARTRFNVRDAADPAGGPGTASSHPAAQGRGRELCAPAIDPDNRPAGWICVISTQICVKIAQICVRYAQLRL